ncbi:MAG: AzlC family ABC transporter permease [Anaerolineales bacterium]|nr:AzlC family ABC transporter permease [Anaerolineales bacterium]
MNEARKEFIKGIRAEIPILIGVFPFGLIYGALAVNAGLKTIEAQAMSVLVFAGSAQFITAQLVGMGTPALVMVLTIAVVNLRHMLYSASLAPYLKDVSLKWKVLLSYLLTDEAYAPSILHYEEGGALDFKHWFLLGAGIGLWTDWQISTAIGVFLGAALPANLSLDFALPLTFIAMIVPTMKKFPTIAAASSAGVVALFAHPLPYKLGLIVAALVGIAVGMALEGRKSAEATR